MKNSLILFAIFAVGFLAGGATMWSQIKFVEEVGLNEDNLTTQDITQNLPPKHSREWNCKQVITCEPADWIGIDGHGRAKPEDYCQYEYRIINSVENPANYPDYGAKCW